MVASSQMSGTGSFGADYPRLLLALQDAVPGDLFFVQINSPVQRRRLPQQLAADGLRRPFAVADFATLPVDPLSHSVLRQFLKDLKPALPEILFVDGLEHRIDSDPKPGGALEALNLSRERLADLGVIVIFLLPAYLIDLIRARALNLWTWRAHHYSLEPAETSVGHNGIARSLDTGRSIAPGDTPGSRDRRIRILQRLFDEGLAEHRTLDSLTHSVLLPLVRDLYDAGRFTEALIVLDRMKGNSEKTEDSLDNATISNLRALVLRALGKFNEVEPLYKRTLTIREKVLGPDHPDVATSFNNLALFYYNQGKYAKAEQLHQQALAIREKALGPDHPDMAASLNNLALLNEAQGRYVEAEQLYKRSLVIYEKTLGPNHPSVAGVFNNLAELYCVQGKHIQAEQLHQQALAIREKTLGSNHPDVAHSLNNLAELYRTQGRYTEAEPLFQQSLAIMEKTLGPDHPDVAASLNNSANLYHVQGKYAQAEPLYMRALAIREKILGPEHPDVAGSLGNYAALLQKMNREAEAAEMEARAKAIRDKHA
jgi:tetratricopeptide (TPR) repeat protein